jgi:hypothetical protein
MIYPRIIPTLNNQLILARISRYLGVKDFTNILSIKGLRGLLISEIAPAHISFFADKGYSFYELLQLLLLHGHFEQFRKIVRRFSHLIYVSVDAFNGILRLLIQHRHFEQFRWIVQNFSHLFSVSVDAFNGILRLLIQHRHFAEFRWIVQNFSHLFSVSVDAFSAIPEERYVALTETLQSIVVHSTIHHDSMLFVYQHMALSEFLNTQTNPVTRDMLYVFISTLIMTPANQRTFLPLGHTVVFDENQIRSQYRRLKRRMLGTLDGRLYGYNKSVLVIRPVATGEVMSYDVIEDSDEEIVGPE